MVKKNNIDQTFDMIERKLKEDKCRFVGRMDDDVYKGVSCYLVSDDYSIFFVVYAVSDFDYVMEAHLPCKRLDDITRRDAAVYASKHVFKNSIRGKLDINDNEFVFKTEIPIGNDVVTADVFERCMHILLLELLAQADNLLEISHGLCPKEEDNKELLHRMLKELKQQADEFIEESKGFMTIPDGIVLDEEADDDSFDEYEKNLNKSEIYIPDGELPFE